MPTESARRLMRVVLAAGDVTDQDLLSRFAATRDEDAFAELVRRHGAMVLGVCRRVTGHPHDAEDAFQAAFVVLARRAGQLRRPEQLANWLYGVAYRTSLEARTARRRVQEQPVSSAPEPAARPEPDDTADLRRVIDEELARLPDKYRSAVVLCDLEGASRAEAASRLGIPEGTLSSRLAQARKVLAERLTRRGVTASAGLVATALGRDAAAVVPRELVTLTARVARAAASGAVPAGAVSASVSSLADGVMKTMLATRLRLALGAAALGLIGLGAYGLAQVPARNAQNSPNVPLTPPAVAAPAPNAFDPFAGVPVQQPKAEKVAPKGIEDDDVPYGASPAQAVVRVEDGKLIVRQRGFHYQAVTQTIDNHPVTSYQRKSGVQAATHDAADISVFDMKGNQLQPKAWKQKLASDVHALVAFDGRVPHPRELGLFKEDTLLVVLPAATGPASIAPYSTELPTVPPARTAPPSTAPAPARPPGQNPLRPATAPPVLPPDGGDLPPEIVPTAPGN